jgi:2-amino-4-hydroxy-6-hydroxymethyldihydropteridine diphosphokinase
MKKVKGNRFLVALGSNSSQDLERNVASLHDALRLLRNVPALIIRLSRMWRTPAFPARSGPDFVNACAEIECALDAEEMLAALHGIEAALGRVREARWEARVIDLDLLAEGARVVPDEEKLRRWIDLPLEAQMREAPERLILPHPRLQDRAFVLVPLAEIAPGWRHPLLGRTVAEMRDALDPAAVAELRVLSSPGGARDA